MVSGRERKEERDRSRRRDANKDANRDRHRDGDSDRDKGRGKDRGRGRDRQKLQTTIENPYNILAKSLEIVKIVCLSSVCGRGRVHVRGRGRGRLRVHGRRGGEATAAAAQRRADACTRRDMAISSKHVLTKAGTETHFF